MDIRISNVHRDIEKWDVIRAVAAVLHARESKEDRKINFHVEMDKNQAGGVSHNGKGRLTIPQATVGARFLLATRDKPIVLGGKKVAFKQSSGKPPHRLITTLAKTPFIDPDIDERHFTIEQQLRDNRIRIELVQFGVYHRPRKAEGRRFSIEWERNYAKQSAAWLKILYGHKLLQIEVRRPFLALLQA